MCIHYEGSLDVIVLLQASPEKKTKKQQEDANRVMKDLLGQAAVCSLALCSLLFSHVQIRPRLS
jgi:hypothetical protein